jgi:hypothetical protein
MTPARPGVVTRRAHISAVGCLEYVLRSHASEVALALVANTMVAQLLYNSTGRPVLGNQVAQPRLPSFALPYPQHHLLGATIVEGEGHQF